VQKAKDTSGGIWRVILSNDSSLSGFYYLFWSIMPVPMCVYCWRCIIRVMANNQDSISHQSALNSGLAFNTSPARRNHARASVSG